MAVLKRCIVTFLILSLCFVGCGLFEFETEEPTKSRMEGIWKVTEAYNENEESILNTISFPVAAFQMQGENSFLSTGEPMIAYVVYGASDVAGKYAEIASKFDQALDYSKLEIFKSSEWFIGTGVVDRFTLEMKIEGFPGVGTIAEVLSWLGIQSNIPILTIYHKFKYVKVTFDDLDDSKMIWEFDDETEAIYNSKDEVGDDYLWNGVNAKNFARCKFVLTKQVKTLKELMLEK